MSDINNDKPVRHNRVGLLIPSRKVDEAHYLQDFLDSILSNSNIFEYIYVLAQGYGDEESALRRKYEELPMKWEFGQVGEFGDNISKVRQHMTDNAPDNVDYYLVADDDMIHHEGSGEYILNCTLQLDLPENSDVEFSCMTDSRNKSGIVQLKTWTNVDMRCGILLRRDYLKNHKFYEAMRIGEDVTLFIEAFLSGYKGVKFYNAPITHLKDKKLTGGYTKYYKSNVSEFSSDPKASIYHYKDIGILKMRPKVFTEKAWDIHKENYLERFGKNVDYS